MLVIRINPICIRELVRVYFSSDQSRSSRSARAADSILGTHVARDCTAPCPLSRTSWRALKSGIKTADLRCLFLFEEARSRYHLNENTGNYMFKSSWLKLALRFLPRTSPWGSLVSWMGSNIFPHLRQRPPSSVAGRRIRKYSLMKMH